MDKNEVIRISQTMAGTGGRIDYAEHLYDLASKLPDNSIIVEIGTQNGGSACVFGNTLKDRGAKIYCVDPCFIKLEDRPESYKAYNEICENYTLDTTIETFKKYSLDNIITCLPGTSEEILSRWTGTQIDMLYIDGCHTYEAVLIDMMWLRFAKAKCMLVLDDWIQPVQQACEQQLGMFQGFNQRTDHTFWPMYYTRGY